MPNTTGGATGRDKMSKTIKCCRCNGTGFVLDGRTCFRCNGNGEVVADVFLRVLGTGSKFYGVTGPAVSGKRSKEITRNVSDLINGYVATEISEEQARIFYKRYGISTTVAE